MDHDLAGLLDSEGFKNIFREDQLKCYMKQLLEGLLYLHNSHILHRDIKAANLLVNNKGELKLADFGLARPIPNTNSAPATNGTSSSRLTNKVITLWYRPPELLLGAMNYSSSIDMWSAGILFAELLERKNPFSGNHKTEEEQLDLIWKLVGTPTNENWPTAEQLPLYANLKPKVKYPSSIAKRYGRFGLEAVDLLEKLLTLDPEKRIDASTALDANYFFTDPLPCRPDQIQPYLVASHEFVAKNRRRKMQQIQNDQSKPNYHHNSHPQYNQQYQKQNQNNYQPNPKRLKTNNGDAVRPNFAPTGMNNDKQFMGQNQYQHQKQYNYQPGHPQYQPHQNKQVKYQTIQHPLPQPSYHQHLGSQSTQFLPTAQQITIQSTGAQTNINIFASAANLSVIKDIITRTQAENSYNSGSSSNNNTSNGNYNQKNSTTLRIPPRNIPDANKK